MIFDLYTTLALYDRPRKTALNRAMSHAFGMDNPIGDPFGGAAYGKFESPVVKAVEDAGRWIDREVLQPVYKEVIQPVGKALEKIGQGIAKDPLTFIAQAAAVALAPVTGGMSLWALPVIAAASTAAKGGSLEQILTATAVSAATAAIGGGFGMENSVGGLIMNGLQTGGVAGTATATYGIMGTSIATTTAQAIATAGTGVAMAGISAGAAAVQGKDAWAAAFPTLIGSAIGAGTTYLGGTAAFSEVGKTLDEISKTVGPTVAKALSGVATATITGALTGKDMTQAAMTSLAGTAVSGLVSSTNFVADFFRNDAGGITNMGVATQSVVADMLGSVAATIASGGKMGTVMGAQFLTNTVKTLSPFLTPGFDALATNVQATYKDAEVKVNKLNDAANAQQDSVDEYNAAVKKTNDLAAEINGLISKRDTALSNYNKATTQADIDKYKAEFNNLEGSIASKTKDYNAVYNTIDSINADYLAKVKATELAQKEYFDVSKTLGTLGTQLNDKMNDMSKTLVQNVVKDIDPNFNEADYKKYNNLGAGVDAYTHFLSVGKDQGLPTNKDAAAPMIQDEYSRLAKEVIQKQWGIWNPPASMVADLKSKLYMQYGDNLNNLKSATADNLTSWSTAVSKNIDGFLPAYNSQQAKDAQLKQTINEALTPGWYQPVDYKVPAGMKYASQQDIAEMMATGAKVYSAIDDKGYTVYLKQDESYKPVQKYNPTTGNIEPTASALNDMVTLQNMNATDKVKFLAKMSQETSDYLAKTDPDLLKTAEYAKTIYNAVTSADTPNFLKTTVTSMLGAAGSVAQQTKMLGDLADFVGLSSVSDKTSDIYKWGVAMENAANALTPQEYKTAMDQANSIIKNAEGVWGTTKAFGTVLKDYGAEVTASVLVKEIAEEIIQLPSERLASAGAGSLALALGYSNPVSAAVATGAGISMTVYNNLSESYVGSYNETKNKLIELGVQNGMTKDEAAAAAEPYAREAGLYGMMPTAVMEAVLPKTFAKWLFPNASAGQTELINKFYDAVKMVATESGKEGVENSLQSLTNGLIINSVYPGAVDLPKEMTVGMAWGLIVGGPTAAGAGAASSGADGIYTLTALGNSKLGEAIVKFQSGGSTLADFGKSLNQWLPSDNATLQSVKADIMPDIFRTATVDLSASYSDPTNFMEAIKSNLGIYETASLADIANSSPKFAGKVTTLDEAKAALTNAGYTNVTDQDALNAGIVGTTKSDQSNIVKTYVDTHTVTDAEAKKYFADLGYNPTEAEIAQFVGQGSNIDQNAMKTKATSYADEHTVTAAEAKKFLTDLGYNPTQSEINQYVFSGQNVDQAKIKDDLTKYVDTHQFTEAEAKKYFADMGYTPTDAEIKSFIKQGANIDQSLVQKDVGAYIDPRQVTTAEATKMLADAGYNVATAQEIAKFVGQGDANKAVQALADIKAYSDTHTVTEDEVKAYFKLQGYDTPTAEQLTKFVSQGAATDQTKTKAEAEAFADPLAVLASEARDYFAKEGYIPSVEELKTYTGVMNEADTAKLIYAYADPLSMTEEEARAYMKQAGYTSPTAGEVAQFVKQAKESDLQSALLSYVDNHQVTQAEVDSFYKTLGYVPTKEEVAQFITQGIDVQQKAVEAKLAEYVDPRYATADEIKQAYIDLGFGEPTQADIDRFTGQRDEAAAIKEAEGYLPVAMYHATKEQIAAVEQSLTDKIAAYEAEGKTRDEALKLAIDGVAADLGTTKTDLLTAIGQTEADLVAKIGATETSLKGELGTVKTELTQDIQNVAELLGKPVQEVTQADLDYVKSVIGKTDVTPDMLYDVNRDNVIDIKDQTALENQIRIQQGENVETKTDPATGIVTTIDKLTGQTIDAWNPQTGSKWASSGIYKVLEDQKAQAAATAKAAADQAAKNQKKSQFGTLMGALFAQPNAFQQTTTVKAPDPTKIGYIYDFSSIFANPSQASLMPSPYGPMNTVAPQQQQQQQQRPQASNQPLFQLASGFAEGGIVGGNDMEVGGSSNIDDLINIIKGNSG